jgi:16S rRNA (uracil1498-N3)-methyltransferase
MRLHRFFIEQKIETNNIVVTGEALIHQWRNVFRMKPGEKVVLFNNSGFEFEAEITRLEKKEAELIIDEKREGAVRPRREATLFMSLIKKDNFEWVVEKATELGITKIVPILATRSEKKNINMDRLQKIAREASEQSGRTILPEIGEIVSFSDALQMAKGTSFMFHLSGTPLVPEGSETNTPVSLFIGPEGGWTDEEIAEATQKGVEVRKLGGGVLRAETAAIAISTLFLL